MRTRVIFCILFLVPVIANVVHAGDASLADIEAITKSPRYKLARWGIHVADAKTGEEVLAIEPDSLLTPASVTKLYSVAAALEALGADHRFTTPVYRRGEVSNGSLDGDLILVAKGDLTLGGRTTEDGKIAFTSNDHTYADANTPATLTKPDPLAGLNELARQVAAAGIKRVTGQVIIDDRLFDPAESTGSGPARLTPIYVNDNLIDVTTTPGKAGEPAKVEWRPRGEGLTVDAQVETVEGDAKPEIRITELAPGRLKVRGRIAASDKPVVRVFEVSAPASFARAMFIDALKRAGVSIDASTHESNPGRLAPSDYSKLTEVAKLTSPPLSENAKLILKVSHNQHASTLPLLLAASQGKRTLQAGLRAQHEALKKLGVNVNEISFGGGAGGSRADLVTARATTQLLRAMMARPTFAVYREALPVLGVDGTLARACAPNSPAKGKVLAKTGTYVSYDALGDRFILLSKALAGYLTTSRDRPLVFAIMVNNAPLGQIRDREEIGKDLARLCEAMVKNY